MSRKSGATKRKEKRLRLKAQAEQQISGSEPANCGPGAASGTGAGQGIGGVPSGKPTDTQADHHSGAAGQSTASQPGKPTQHPGHPYNPTAPTQSIEPPTDGAAFWPELDPARRAMVEAQATQARARLQGEGASLDSQERYKLERQVEEADTLKTAAELRLELRAVRNEWPVPQGMRERMVYDAYMVTQSPHVSTREKLLAQRLLLMMQAANQRKGGLPGQIDAGPAGQAIPAGYLTAGDLLQEMEYNRSAEVLDAEDFREIQAEPGGENDYADQ